MRKPFSKYDNTFPEWIAHTLPSNYRRRIERAHARYPQASLAQLRGHPKRRESPIGSLKAASKAKMKYQLLRPKEREIRDRALDAISSMRLSGTSLKKAAKEMGTTPQSVRKYTEAVKKVDKRWMPKTYDVVPRPMWINEDGAANVIQIIDSRHASLIGRYHSAVGQALSNRDESYLIPFKGRSVRDIDGQWHILETDLHRLYEIMERRPNDEFFSIYALTEGD